ncbi:hypothetical protein RM533_05615 [Croceicoccus sp. F390]|uniref:Uncharacterized protein n=1 Tax=Croceicoccus esteveae TaxID=3075597 RepID=A0ABU2ZH19_9SPHN|nr:hypothetical protein [Croceicoccus sp. F390]MDT0575656.1 hypothetical protein [Croceicoccus sp. F390]
MNGASRIISGVLARNGARTCPGPIPASTRQAIIAGAGISEPSALWDAQAVAASVGGQASGTFEAGSVAISPQEVEQGTLYFAQAELDAQAAFAKGATGIVCSKPVGGPHVLVDDTERALERLARAARNRTRATVIAILGFGRNTAPASLDQALKLASKGMSFAANTEQGLDLALARLASDNSHALFGIDDVDRPAVLRPHLLILGSAASRAGGCRAASALQPGGSALMPADHSDFACWRAAALDAGAQVFGYGRKASAEIRLLDRVAGPFGGSLVTADMNGRKLCYTIAAEADAAASLAVVGAMHMAGASPGAAAMILAAEAFGNNDAP